VPITHAAEKLRLVLYGEPGVGKTTLAMSFPRPFVINTDDGLVAVTSESPEAVLGEQVDVTSYKDLEALYFWLKERADDFDTVIVDSLDELAFILTDELIARGHEFDTRKGKEMHPVTEFIPEQAEYLANQRQLHAFLTALRRLDKHLVVVLGVRAADPPKQPKRGPNLAPGAAGDLARWASVIGEMVVTDQGRALIVRNGDPARVTKTRYRALDPYVLNPTFEKLNPTKETK
jgi:hypothetical protein